MKLSLEKDESQALPIEGRHFYLLKASGPIEVKFIASSGEVLEELDFLAGQGLSIERFNRIEFTNKHTEKQEISFTISLVAQFVNDRAVLSGALSVANTKDSPLHTKGETVKGKKTKFGTHLIGGGGVLIRGMVDRSGDYGASSGGQILIPAPPQKIVEANEKRLSLEIRIELFKDARDSIFEKTDAKINYAGGSNSNRYQYVYSDNKLSTNADMSDSLDFRNNGEFKEAKKETASSRGQALSVDTEFYKDETFTYLRLADAPKDSFYCQSAGIVQHDSGGRYAGRSGILYTEQIKAAYAGNLQSQHVKSLLISKGYDAAKVNALTIRHQDASGNKFYYKVFKQQPIIVYTIEQLEE